MNVKELIDIKVKEKVKIGGARMRNLGNRKEGENVKIKGREEQKRSEKKRGIEKNRCKRRSSQQAQIQERNSKDLIKHRSDLINGTGADNNKVIPTTIYGADFSIFTPPRRRLPREHVDLRSS